MRKARSRSNITPLWQQSNMEMLRNSKANRPDVSFIFIVCIESYVLPERPSRLNKEVMRTGVTTLGRQVRAIPLLPPSHTWCDFRPLHAG